MSKRIEEVLNLPSYDSNDNESEEQSIESEFDIDDYRQTLETADIIDQALPAVRDLDALDKDMDDYALKAMKAFDDLMDLGNNVEDRNAAGIFDVAGKMMNNAIVAKTAKLDKKLKVIELQMRKRRLDLEEKKVQLQLEKQNPTNDEEALEGDATEFDRNELIGDIISRIKNSKD
jgi:hypothetical protein